MGEFALRHAESEAAIIACLPALRQLRPHLVDDADFLARVRRQQKDGYWLLAAVDGDHVIGAVGYRMQENPIRGRFVYVDDLIVLEGERRRGVGARLLDEVAKPAKEAGCAWMTLDTAVGNALGQRFYFRWGLLSTSLHFTKRLL